MTAPTAIDALISLGRELGETKNAAYDLWTWLPSHKRAVAAHGDYADNYTPSIHDVVREATEFISHDCRPSAEQQTEAGDLYRCPCGDDHGDTDEDSPGKAPHGAWPIQFS